jgi:hypothetical protein
VAEPRRRGGAGQLTSAECAHCCRHSYADNLVGKTLESKLCLPPMDIVYTWVNGSDERLQAGGCGGLAIATHTRCAAPTDGSPADLRHFKRLYGIENNVVVDKRAFGAGLRCPPRSARAERQAARRQQIHGR